MVNSPDFRGSPHSAQQQMQRFWPLWSLGRDFLASHSVFYLLQCYSAVYTSLPTMLCALEPCSIFFLFPLLPPSFHSTHFPFLASPTSLPPFSPLLPWPVFAPSGLSTNFLTQRLFPLKEKPSATSSCNNTLRLMEESRSNT